MLQNVCIDKKNAMIQMFQEKNLTPASEPSALSPGMSSAFPSLARAWIALCSTHNSIPQNSVVGEEGESRAVDQVIFVSITGRLQ